MGFCIVFGGVFGGSVGRFGLKDVKNMREKLNLNHEFADEVCIPFDLYIYICVCFWIFRMSCLVVWNQYL